MVLNLRNLMLDLGVVLEASLTIYSDVSSFVFFLIELCRLSCRRLLRGISLRAPLLNSEGAWLLNVG